MTLQVVAAGRAAAERMMTDTCVIGKIVRSKTIDEASGEYPETISPVYSGRCKYTVAQQLQVRDVDSQGQDLAVGDGILAIPIGAPGSSEVAKDHVAEITLSSYDSVVITAVIQAGHAQTIATARRFPVEVTT